MAQEYQRNHVTHYADGNVAPIQGHSRPHLRRVNLGSKIQSKGSTLWQTKVWQRHHCRNVAALETVSARYILAHHAKTAVRREAAPQRRRFPPRFTFDLQAPLAGTMIYIRRSTELGDVNLLGHNFRVAEHWLHRLVRCEVDFTREHIRFHVLRRRDSTEQPLLTQIYYARPSKPFKGSP